MTIKLKKIGTIFSVVLLKLSIILEDMTPISLTSQLTINVLQNNGLFLSTNGH